MSKVEQLPTARAETVQEPAPYGDGEMILRMIDRLIDRPDIDVDRIEQFWHLYERTQAHRARLAFDAAMSAMQPQLPIIERRGRIRNSAGKEQSQYALWEDVVEQINPVTRANGFALTFKTANLEGGRIRVTCILSHAEGHREETSLELPCDTTGSKNAVQSLGSSVSYGKRYTAFALLNIVARGEDDDGNRGGGKVVSDQQAETIRNLITSTESDVNKFLAVFQVDSISDLPEKDYDRAASLLAQKASRGNAR